MVDDHEARETFGERFIYDNKRLNIELLSRRSRSAKRWEYSGNIGSWLLIALIMNASNGALIL
ncbi:MULTISPECIES: hypothetical protein [Amycolatopsis]|uniref:hypothetical protein n=1 Tax=Amycolatopsis TaxID=1813 RepID=UPI000B8ACA1A|nr:MULTISPECIES: hypothetical protein [Amycolatopsis]OXM71911.1 hypothetical protein CF166_17565 [Amycolatopsis sp. KNN50.9b]